MQILWAVSFVRMKHWRHGCDFYLYGVEHQPYGENINRMRWNINRTGGTSTVRAEHQPHGRNINHTGGTSTARGKHQPYEREHQPHRREHQPHGQNINRMSKTSTVLDSFYKKHCLFNKHSRREGI
ncbi:hypothetical protein [Virgibacillus ihumii]|uniref:hypothetical protein n=1 Tax=Virgibacillus ihumii TaxID=2686091 RepID=UPI00157E0BC0|nr:hypothetical protein [Virgibacillus ihumii]